MRRQSRLRVEADGARAVVSRGRFARSYWSRLKGLLGTRVLPDGDGLLIEPCNSIHMFFMAFPIDAVYLDDADRILRVAAELKPWRVGPIVGRAKRVLELPAGKTAALRLAEGDHLLIIEE